MFDATGPEGLIAVAVAIALDDGAPEVAQADDVVEMLARNEGPSREALDTGTYR